MYDRFLFRDRGKVRTLNEVFSSASMRRRYEVWFLRMGLADGSGAWWFRYLLMNPARAGCGSDPNSMPVQVWATWFPAGHKPHTVIDGFPTSQFHLASRNTSPFHFRAGENEISEDFCRGFLISNGHKVEWNLTYQSNFRVTLSNKGWIGFSRTPHSDAVFSGEISLDGQRISGTPLGFGVQGHNCGYRHRNFWRWTHAFFFRPEQPASTLEALIYEMPLGLIFGKVVLWHNGKKSVFRKVRETNIDRDRMLWQFSCTSGDGLNLEATISGASASTHVIPYLRTDCRSTFDVSNNSLAAASLLLRRKGATELELSTKTGAVLEMVG